jgi:hypothetical protein
LTCGSPAVGAAGAVGAASAGAPVRTPATRARQTAASTALRVCVRAGRSAGRPGVTGGSPPRWCVSRLSRRLLSVTSRTSIGIRCPLRATLRCLGVVRAAVSGSRAPGAVPSCGHPGGRAGPSSRPPPTFAAAPRTTSPATITAWERRGMARSTGAGSRATAAARPSRCSSCATPRPPCSAARSAVRPDGRPRSGSCRSTNVRTTSSGRSDPLADAST